VGDLISILGMNHSKEQGARPVANRSSLAALSPESFQGMLYCVASQFGSPATDRGTNTTYHSVTTVSPSVPTAKPQKMPKDCFLRSLAKTPLHLQVNKVRASEAHRAEAAARHQVGPNANLRIDQPYRFSRNLQFDNKKKECTQKNKKRPRSLSVWSDREPDEIVDPEIRKNPFGKTQWVVDPEAP